MVLSTTSSVISAAMLRLTGNEVRTPCVGKWREIYSRAGDGLKMYVGNPRFWKSSRFSGFFEKNKNPRFCNA